MRSQTINDHWCQYIPNLHRALADSSQICYLPYVAEELPLEQACSAWEPIHYLFTALLGWRSWHVEVVDRQVGWLGEYRKSRETGRWFLGRHSLHMRGNP